MYNERREGFSIKDVILQLLFVVLFVFILIWLFPTKSSLKGITNQFDVLTNRIFNENIQTMKEAAIGYYTTPRLPKKIKDTKSMTLREMIESSLIIEFKDANGKSCDLDDSYVEITKYEDEYQMVVNLKCTDNDAHIVVYLGCYDYCDKDVCEAEKTPVYAPVVNTPVKPPVNPPVEPPKPVAYEYKYIKTVGDSYSNWSSWSNWSTTKAYETSLRDVDTKNETYYSTERQVVSYNSVKVEDKNNPIYTTERKIVGYNTVKVEDKNSPIYGYEQVQYGYTETKTCTAYKTEIVYTGEYKGTWVSQGKSLHFSTPKNDSTTRFKYISSTDYSCGSCVGGVAAYYEKEVYKTYQVTTEKQVCSQYKTTQTPVYGTVKKVTGYKTTTIQKPVYGDVKKIVGYKTKTVQEPVYGYVQVKNTVKYYRFRTRHINGGYTDYKWSNSSNDGYLTDRGYYYTGIKREKK